MIRIGIEDNASQSLAEMADRIGDMTALMTSMGHHMENSVRRNFNEGGRPDAWAELAGVTVLPTGTRRKRGGRERIQGKSRLGGPLVLTGDLRGSIGFTPEAADLVLWARPTPAVKGPVHQYGTTVAGRNHNITIPARPFLMFQKSDIEWFKRSLQGWIRVGARGVER